MKRWIRRRGRLVSIFVVVLGLVLGCVLLIRFYPYPWNLTNLPRLTQTASGADGDPINLVFVGSREQITQSFQHAGWLTPDLITPQTAARIAADSLAHRSYPTAPVSPLYVFGRVQDLAFEKPTNDVQNRGHIRLWETSTLLEEQPVWLGQASYDSGIELSSATHFPTHHIAPAVDWERNSVGADLEKTGLVTAEAYAAFTVPIFAARNGGGDYYESDGDALVINYTSASLPLHQQTVTLGGLKNGVFLIYDIFATDRGALGAFLLISAVCIVGLMLIRARKRDAARERGQLRSNG